VTCAPPPPPHSGALYGAECMPCQLIALRARMVSRPVGGCGEQVFAELKVLHPSCSLLVDGRAAA